MKPARDVDVRGPSLVRMDELFTLHPNGLFLRREALDLGYHDRDLLRARREGHLVRLRQGAYMPKPQWDQEDDPGKHRLRSQAVILTHGDGVVLSHTSGAIAHGMTPYGADLSAVHVTRVDGNRGNRRAGIIYHELNSRSAVVETASGLPVLDPTSCALGAGSAASMQAAVCVLDSYLHLGYGDEADLMAAYLDRSHWPDTRHLRVAVALARKGAETVGESCTRFLFWSHHLPEPVLQYSVCDERGNLIGTTDFAWPQYKLLGEFDGKVKYGRLLRPGQKPEDVVFAEKLREDALREATDFRMIRYIWADLYKAVITAARTRRMLGLPAAA